MSNNCKGKCRTEKDMNIAEIAKLAGVSSAAVSRYFNNGYISESKKEAIRKVVDETGYRPSLQAQTLRTRKTMMIGVIAPKVASYSVGRVVDGIMKELDESGYHMLLAVTQNDPKREIEYLNAFNGKQVDGVILIGTVFTAEHKSALKQMKVPVVIVGQNLQGYSSVYHDDLNAMYDMTRYLMKHGRKHPAYIGVLLQDEAAGKARNTGFVNAVTDAGHPEMAVHTEISEFSLESGREAAGRIMDAYPETDALICATDEIAVGALELLLERGIKVPDKVMVTGQGDSKLLRAADHGIGTIRYSYERSGVLAAGMLLEKLNGDEDIRSEIKLGYSLVFPEVR